MPSLLTLFTFFRAALLASLSTGAQAESWYVVRIAGTPVGYLHETVETTDNGRVVTAQRSEIVINRLENRVEMANSAAFTESSADGRLVEVRAEVRLSRNATTTVATFADDGSARIVTAAGGREYPRDVPAGGIVIGPERIREVSRAGLAKAGDRVEYRTFVAERLAIETVARAFEARDEIGLRVSESMTGQVPRTIWLDSDGRLARARDTSPLGEITIETADETTALGAARGGSLPEEMYDRTIVRANVRLPRSRDLDSLTVRMRLLDPSLGFPDGLEREGQRVVSRSKNELVLRIERPAAPAAGAPRVAPPRGEFLEPNGLLASDDAEVVRIAAEVAGAEKDAWRAALALEKWVHENMGFDLGIVLAPASEVARNRRGTCSGYAVFLTSLLRAAGVPSRFVMGFVYANGAFGGHAWTEVRLGGAWLPLDAAVHGPAPAGAGRIAFAAGSLESGTSEMNVAGQRLYGNVDIDVIEYVADGKRVAVPEGQPLFTIDGDRFASPGLGLALRKPAGFAFEKAGAAWPDDTIVAMTDGETTVTLRQTEKIPEGAVAARAVTNGPDAFVLEARGPAKTAAEALEAVAATLAFTPSSP